MIIFLITLALFMFCLVLVVIQDYQIKAGILFRFSAPFFGWYYSKINRRVCINPFPCVTIWIASKYGMSPKEHWTSKYSTKKVIASRRGHNEMPRYATITEINYQAGTMTLKWESTNLIITDYWWKFNIEP